MAAEAPAEDLGWPAAEFQLPGTDGLTHGLHELAGERGTVGALISINSNAPERFPENSFERMVELAPTLSFPYLYDASQAVAAAYGAVCTPDFFGFDAELRLRYRGRLDASRKETAPG